MKRPNIRSSWAAATLALALLISLVSWVGSASPALRGDWDYYRMLGAKPSGGVVALRRFGFPPLEGNDSTRSWVKPPKAAPVAANHSHIRSRPPAGLRLAPAA